MPRVEGLKYFLLVIAGFLILLIGFWKTPHYPKPQQTQASRQQISEPSHISISKIGVDADIVRGGIVKGEWILSDTQVLYLPTSGLFVNLTSIEEGDLITVSDRQGRKYNYQVYQKEDIRPKRTEKLVSTQKNDLTLFTCDGIFDESILLVKAKFISFKST